MSCAAWKKVAASCKLARLLSVSEQQWRRAIRQSKRTATTDPAQDARMMVGHSRVHANNHDSKPLEAPIARGSENQSSKIFRTTYARRPVDLGHVGTSSFVHAQNAAGDINRTTFIDSAYLGQADDVHAMRSAYNDAQERHVRYGSNADVVNQDFTVPPLDRGSPEPDAGSPAGTRASVTNRTPLNNPFAATNQKLLGDTPQQHNSTSLAQEYHVRKAQVHASLWKQEIRKQAGNLQRNADFVTSDSLISSLNSKEVKGTIGWDANKTAPEDWETFDPLEGDLYDESPGKEEALMFEEFEKRRERNRIKIASFVKQHLYGRRRPVDGWKYIINNFGTDPKASKDSTLGGRQTSANDLEKLALKRESGRLRRKA